MFQKELRNKKHEDTAPNMNILTLEDVGELKSNVFNLDRSKMLLRMFEAHGKFCASHPWEVILVTVSIVICGISISLVESDIGGNHTKSMNSKTLEFKDIVIPMITRSLAIVYIYLQFSKLRSLGSKYPLGITGILTLMFSFCLRAGMINLIGIDIKGLSETTTIFLLLVDLSKACTLAKFALSSKCQDEIIGNMGQGMAAVGPAMTLDAIVETLVIGVGTLSEVQTLQTACRFGCSSVVANYFAFMTFYPACLAIVLEWTGDHRRLVQIQQFASAWRSESESQKPNPVSQKVKMIMSAGLLVIHVHTRLTSPLSLFTDPSKDLVASDQAYKDITDDADRHNLPILERLLGLNIDYFSFSITLVIMLCLKYIFIDPGLACTGAAEKQMRTVTTASNSGSVRPDAEMSDDNNVTRSSRQDVGIQTDDLKKSEFFIGCDSSDEENDREVTEKQLVDFAVQVSEIDLKSFMQLTAENSLIPRSQRDLKECIEIYKSQGRAKDLTDEEIMALVESKHIPLYKLEDELCDLLRAVRIRRKVLSKKLTKPSMDNLPYLHYDYSYVKGQCCENVVGYVPVPVGVAGPLLVNGRSYVVPMATTEGCLLASTNRGCQALSSGKGVVGIVTRDGMTRAPVVKFGSSRRAAEVMAWLEEPENFEVVAEAFNGTSRFARLKEMNFHLSGRTLHIRFCATTGDAMGMNMLSKGCQAALLVLQEKYFNDMEILSLSGNFCTDKKPNAVNWILGRGKSVSCEAVIPGSVVKRVLKTDVDTLVNLNIEKNLKGSIVAGSIGGFNAQASNIVTALFIATGQDPAQNISSSNCLTTFEKEGTDDLYVSCTMPCVEVGTVGGGTILPAQSACLEMLGVRGSNEVHPSLNARTLAIIVCSVVLAGEVSLMSALASGDLVKSHLKHNRSIAANMSRSPQCSSS